MRLILSILPSDPLEAIVELAIFGVAAIKCVAPLTHFLASI